MSIGALSRATGVPAETLRTWERRYGFPTPERTDAGHRRYSMRTLDRLRLVTRALDLGHRPSTALGADEDTLRGWLAAGPNAPTSTTASSSARELEIVERWLGHVERFEGRAFERELRVAAAEYGGLDWLEHLVAPFLRELGARWADGRIGVRHEHFASERLRELLAQQWRPLSDAATGPVIVLATPPGELHVLGLHMAAQALALHNARLVFLGANAPVDEIASAVEQHSAEAVVLSAAEGADHEQLARALTQLRSKLGRSIPVVTGGRGFLPALPGVQVSQHLFELVGWVSGLR